MTSAVKFPEAQVTVVRQIYHEMTELPESNKTAACCSLSRRSASGARELRRLDGGRAAFPICWMALAGP
jgi:hypothetical protein